MNKVSRNIVVALTLIAVTGIIYYLSDIFAYILIAWVLSMLGRPLMHFFQEHLKIGRFRAGAGLSAMLTLICYFVLFVLLVVTFVPLVIEQASNLAGVDYKAIAIALEEPLSQLNAWLREMGLVKPEDTPVEQVQLMLKGWFEPAVIGDFFSSLIGVAGNFIISIFAIVFITFFFLKEQGLFVSFLIALVPTRYEQQVRNSVEEVSRMLTRYFGGVLLQILAITVFVSICLSLLGVKNALLIGFFAAIINVVPYIGPMIGAAFGVFITISSNLTLEFYPEMLPLLFKVVAVFAAMQLLDNFLFQPLIFSTSVLAHPLEIFIVILLGAKLNGIVGMVLAIPSYTIIRVIARIFLSEFKLVQRLTERME